ncbi:hypothetical protein EVAR_46036_1 [Eumeta japonica]|uniref:Uncharacterized protein n=1 Tax=Eumeta variegata TaxID=151549 RepID=A0A4C1XIE0_EUMVA|nr:hypothetical protein EVAR_46036_1 [Eumeta japonica]
MSRLVTTTLDKRKSASEAGANPIGDEPFNESMKSKAATLKKTYSTEAYLQNEKKNHQVTLHHELKSLGETARPRPARAYIDGARCSRRRMRLNCRGCARPMPSRLERALFRLPGSVRMCTEYY